MSATKLVSWLLPKPKKTRKPPHARLGLEQLERREVQAGFYSTPLFDGVPRWDSPTELRGVMITPQALVDHYTPHAKNVLGGWGVNVLRVELVADPVGWVNTSDPATYGQQVQQYRNWLNGEIAKIKSVETQLRRDGIGVIIDMHDPVGGPAWGQAGDHQIFSSAKLASQFVEDWKHVARQFMNSNVVVGYDLLNEPDLATATPNATAAEAKPWNDLAAATGRAIRASGGQNANRTLIVEPVEANPYNLRQLRPQDFRGPVAFSFHFYEPQGFTSFAVNQVQGKPVNPAHELFTDRARQHVDDVLNVVRSWQLNNRVRIYVGEFSASMQDGSTLARKQAVADYSKYVTNKFESYRWDWTYHAFREASVWDLERHFGSNAELWRRSGLKVKWNANVGLFRSR